MRVPDLKISDFFSDDELRCKGSGIVKLDPRFQAELTRLRARYGKPMIVNSCCRSQEHNKNVGGASKSYHLFEGVYDGRMGTMAIDIKISGKNRENLVDLAWSLGWSIGEYKNFIHIDRRKDLGKKQIKFKGKY